MTGGFLDDHIVKNLKVVDELRKIFDVTAFAFRTAMPAQVPAVNLPSVLNQDFGERVIAFRMFSQSVGDDEYAANFFGSPSLEKELGLIVTAELTFESL
jgi:hypothetical protein